MISHEAIAGILERIEQSNNYDPMDRHDLQRDLKQNQITIMFGMVQIMNELNEISKTIKTKI